MIDSTGQGTAPLRIGNASGFYGDRFAAMREMLEYGPLDVLTGDYLAELTMLILGRDRLKDPGRGYARTFLGQLEDCLGLAVQQGVRIVANAGGLNPAGLARAVRELAGQLGLDATVAYVEGDDLLPRAGELELGQPLTANAYLGCWGIAECLRAGADVVVTGRTTDAALVAGPAAAHFGWGRDDLDALAGAVAAGHVIECGAQATGGNFSFFTELGDLGRIGFPIAEVAADGSSVITKHLGTGGAVTVETVTAQLLYEIDAPTYLGPDVITLFDTVRLTQLDKDRVGMTGVRGLPPPPTAKVCLNVLGGFRNSTTFVLTGLDLDAKASLVRAQLESALGAEPPQELTWSLARTGDADADTQEGAAALLHCTAKDADPAKVGRPFSRAAVELALASYPGFTVTAPPGDASPYGVYRAAYVPQEVVEQVAVLPDGRRVLIEAPTQHSDWWLSAPEGPEPYEGGETIKAPLGRVVGARSGDKGGTANLGLWARTDDAYRWLVGYLTVERLYELLPETTGLAVTRHLLPNLRAVNFVLPGLLGEGVSSSTRFDPQAKALGEWLRGRTVDVPEALL